MFEFVCLPWSEVCSARVASLILILILIIIIILLLNHVIFSVLLI